MVDVRFSRCHCCGGEIARAHWRLDTLDQESAAWARQQNLERYMFCRQRLCVVWGSRRQEHECRGPA
jgi:hypothetical protein